MLKILKRQNNLKISSHNAIAAGTAHTKPRAKLRPGPRARSSSSGLWSGDMSFIAIALRIVGTNLPLWRSFRHPASAKAWKPLNRPFADIAGTSAIKRGSLSPLADSLSLARMIVSFALEDSAFARSGAVQKAIRLGGESRRRFAMRRSRLAILCASALTPTVASAQPDDRTVITPIDLFMPEASAGVRIGPSLVLKPALDLTIEHDDNIYNRQTNERADTVAIAKPSFRLGTDWSRHELTLDAFAEVRRYFNTSPENSEQWGVKGAAGFDLGDRFGLDLGAGIARRVEPRGSVGDTFASDRPISFTEKNANVQFSRTGGRLELIVGGAIARYSYHDNSLGGVPIDLGDRDVETRQAHVRTNYSVSPRMTFFADLSANQIDYARNLGFARNSSGYGALVGGRYQVSALFDVEGAVGWIGQNYDDPLIGKTSGINYALAASWTPTPRWKLTASGKRSVLPSPLPGVPAIIRGDFEVKALHALGDHVLIEFGAGYANEEYGTSGRVDDHFTANAAVHYRLTPNLLVSVTGGYRKQNSPVFGKNYDGLSVGLSVGVRL